MKPFIRTILVSPWLYWTLSLAMAVPSVLELAAATPETSTPRIVSFLACCLIAAYLAYIGVLCRTGRIARAVPPNPFVLFALALTLTIASASFVFDGLTQIQRTADRAATKDPAASAPDGNTATAISATQSPESI